jgi:hypothetical protein
MRNWVLVPFMVTCPVEIRSGPFCSAMCYYLDMRWRDIAYALAMAVVGAVALTTIMDLASALWR